MLHISILMFNFAPISGVVLKYDDFASQPTQNHFGILEQCHFF
jgi:hypothetical protein